jgi:hypothetical protein
VRTSGVSLLFGSRLLLPRIVRVDLIKNRYRSSLLLFGCTLQLLRNSLLCVLLLGSDLLLVSNRLFEGAASLEGTTFLEGTGSLEVDRLAVMEATLDFLGGGLDGLAVMEATLDFLGGRPFCYNSGRIH